MLALRATYGVCAVCCVVFLCFLAASSRHTGSGGGPVVMLPFLAAACAPYVFLGLVARYAQQHRTARVVLLVTSIVCLCGTSVVLGLEYADLLQAVKEGRARTRQGMILPFIYWLLQCVVVAVVCLGAGSAAAAQRKRPPREM